MIEQDELRWTGRFMGGLREDLARRWPHYLSDFRDGLHPKVVGATLFLFFACLANAIAFGALTGVLTHNQIGIVEMLAITSIGGIAFALFSGQPLTLLGGTGPVTIFTGLLYLSCTQYNISFLAAYAWVGIWSGLMLILCALTDASALMRYFNRFTDEIFAGLISIIFIVEALKDISHAYVGSEDLSKAFLSTLLALGTFIIARNLKRATLWPYLSRTAREFLSDFGPALAIAAMTAFSMQFPEVHLARPAVPEVLGTTSGRPWLVPLGDLPVPAILACMIPAVMVTILLFLDQNITVRIVNSKDNRLKKGSGYHLDLLVVGFLVLGASLFALPWIVAATVHSVNHVKSLSETRVENQSDNKVEVISSVHENRISALTIHLLIGISMFWLTMIAKIPMAVLFGLFLYMGISSLGGNQFWERLLLWVTDSRLYPDTHYLRHVPISAIHKFTLIQLVCLLALWVVKSSKLGIIFPLMIAALVPVYMLVARYFEPHHAALLAAEDQEEVVAMHCI